MLDDRADEAGSLTSAVHLLRLIPLAHFQRLVFGLWPEDNFQRHDSALELGAHLGPRDGRLRILQVLSPTPVKLSPIRVG